MRAVKPLMSVSRHVLRKMGIGTCGPGLGNPCQDTSGCCLCAVTVHPLRGLPGSCAILRDFCYWKHLLHLTGHDRPLICVPAVSALIALSQVFPLTALPLAGCRHHSEY